MFSAKVFRMASVIVDFLTCENFFIIIKNSYAARIKFRWNWQVYFIFTELILAGKTLFFSQK
jgi:hypothetical protein